MSEQKIDILTQQIESLLFISDEPLSPDSIRDFLEEYYQKAFNEEQIDRSISTIQARFASGDFAFELVEIAGGFSFLSKKEFHSVISAFLKKSSPKKLSRVAMETLSIIAYKQPVTKTEIEHIRGVSSDYTIQKLLEKELVSIHGRSEGPGKPLLYTTSNKFMQHFGLRSLQDLPKLKDFDTEDNQIGEPGPSDISLE